MLIAHHDVVSLMVTYIDDNGFLYVRPSGCIDVSILPARKIVVEHEGQSITGIIGKKPVHMIHDVQNERITYEDLWVDIGAKSKDEANRVVSVGDYVYFCSECVVLNNDYITGSYFDNQLGLEVMLKVAKKISDTNIPFNVYFVASNYEEIGMRGAIVAANTIKPDVCICVDVTHATDYPTINPVSEGEISLGDGCVLTKGPNISLPLFRQLRKIAEERKISYQVEVNPYPTGTDANVIQLSGTGVETAVISIPCRYMHTPHEVSSNKDIEDAIDLIYEFISTGF